MSEQIINQTGEAAKASLASVAANEQASVQQVVDAANAGIDHVTSVSAGLYARLDGERQAVETRLHAFLAKHGPQLIIGTLLGVLLGGAIAWWAA